MSSIEYGTVPQRTYSPADDGFTLKYYNYCSEWLLYWSGYCYGLYRDAPLPPMYGTCFDLSDCPSTCRHLEDVWWATKYYHYRGWASIEVYCASESCCPIGPPVAGIYYYGVGWGWQRLHFGGLPLCVCEEGGASKFIIMITEYWDYWEWGRGFAPYSDINSYNIAAGCETEWRCEGHSYCFRNIVDYCDVYGEPGSLWVSGANYGCTNYPTVPPGCHNYYHTNGYFSEFLIECYITCEGATETEEESWSQIKGMYR
jgi:hypothetical protein